MLEKVPQPPGPNGEKTIRTFLVHQHAIVREGFKLLIELCGGISVVGEAKSCSEAIRRLPGLDIDIILLDLNLNLRNSNSIRGLSKLVSAAPKTRLLILTDMADPVLCRQAIKVGGDGLFFKHQRSEVLIKAIKKVNEGEIWLDRSMLAAVLGDMRRVSSQKDEEQDKISSLTTREREVVELVCEGLRNQEIADRLFIGEKTVRNHLASVFNKLDVTHRLELAVYANKYEFADKDRSAVERQSG